jgi:type IV pilus assembly protein PilA
MFLQNLRAKMSARLSGERESGFTLIELLVVMLILGILAAIAIPAFFNQRDKANDADAKAMVKTAQTAIETFATENDGDYTGAGAEGVLTGIEPALQNATLAVGRADDEGYLITVTADTTTNTFSIDNNNGVLTYPCTGGGGCGGEFWN